MSYCRWSCLDGYSDVYVYESDAGYITHVASVRRPAGAPAHGLSLLLAAGGDKDHPAVNLYMEQQRHWCDWSDSAEAIPIDNPEAGASFCHVTPRECADNLLRLRAAGFIVPSYAIDDLLSETEEQSAPKSETPDENISPQTWPDNLLQHPEN